MVRLGWTGRLAPLVAVDLRSLALFRIALGLVVLADLAIRAPDLAPLLGEEGILPRADRLAIYGAGSAVTVWDLVAGAPAARAALFALAIAAGAALVLGWRTRLAAVASWVFVQGFVARMPGVVTGGDLLLAALLLWSAFAPLGARWSIDALRRPPADPPRALASAATAALTIQVAGMMVMAGFAKLADPTWRALDGVRYALRAEFYATPLAHALRELDALMTPLDLAVLGFEIGGVALLLVPWRRDALRLVYAASLIAMNLGFWLCLRVGIFSWTAMAGALLFVPGAAWDALGRRLGGAGARLAGWAAPWRGAPRPWRWTTPRPALALLVVLALLAVYGNLAPRAQLLPRAVRHATQILALGQRGWPMFAPTHRDHGWFVVPGRLADDRAIDLHEDRARPRGGGPLDEAEPPLRAADYPSYRWRKLHAGMRRSAALRAVYLRYQCRRWNADHAGPDALRAVELIYFRQHNLPGGGVSPIERVRLAGLACDAAAAPVAPALAPDDPQGE